MIVPIKGKMNFITGSYSPKGMGDVVEHHIHNHILIHLPQAIADKMRDCNGCHKRRDLLNKLIPFKNNVKEVQPLEDIVKEVQ